MIYILQLVYIHEGTESVFDEFEAVAIPIIARYNGELLFRVRPSKETVIEASQDVPYEIHLVSFPSPNDFEYFKADEERKQFLHLKEKAIKTAILIKGNRI